MAATTASTEANGAEGCGLVAEYGDWKVLDMVFSGVGLRFLQSRPGIPPRHAFSIREEG